MPKGKRHGAQFKFKVALEAARGAKTLSELASAYELHPSQISEWKSQLLRDGVSVFSTTTARQQREQEALQVAQVRGSSWSIAIPGVLLKVLGQ